jgi:hypothetical protein
MGRKSGSGLAALKRVMRRLQHVIYHFAASINLLTHGEGQKLHTAKKFAEKTAGTGDRLRAMA